MDGDDETVEVEIGMAVGGPGSCTSCARTYVNGGALIATPGGLIFGLCQWCVAGWLADITGYKVVEQLANWETAKNSRKPTRWRGWKPPEIAQ